MLPPQAKMFLPMGVMWVYNRFGKDLPVDAARLAYGLVQLIAFVASFYILRRINATASTTEKLTVKMKQPTGPEKEEEMTVRDYDRKEAQQSLSRLAMGAVIVVGLHSWKGFIQPLVIQTVMGLVLLFEDPLFRIYVLRQKPVGALKRPFKKEVSPFASLLGQQPPADEANAEEQANGSSSDGNGQTAKKEVKKLK